LLFSHGERFYDCPHSTDGSSAGPSGDRKQTRLGRHLFIFHIEQRLLDPPGVSARENTRFYKLTARLGTKARDHRSERTCFREVLSGILAA